MIITDPCLFYVWLLPNCPIIISTHSPNPLKASYKQLNATPQILSNILQSVVSFLWDVFPIFLSVTKFWLNCLKALNHFVSGPSDSDLRFPDFAVVCYLILSLGLVYLDV